MDLQHFVSEALQQIVRGVEDAQNSLSDSDAFINPRIQAGDTSNVQWAQSDRLISKVEFDVALTVQAGKETKGGIGVVAGAFTLGSAGKSDASNEQVSRVRFTTLISLPEHKRKKQA